MQCPSCGAPCESGNPECLECGAPAVSDEQNANQERKQRRPRRPAKAAKGRQANTVAQNEEEKTSTLIDFPGVSRNAVPQWRREVSERVREVHEKRARQAALEAAALEEQRKEQTAGSAPLELLPQVESTPVNPLVKAALRRIERANQVTTQGLSRTAKIGTVTALAYAEDADCQDPAHQTFDPATIASGPAANGQLTESLAAGDESTQSDKVHNLAVVPLSIPEVDQSTARVKPRRMIAEDLNHPALNYLDSVPTATRVEKVRHHRAPALYRLLCAGIDLMVVGLLCAPFTALIKLSNETWQDLRVAIIAVAVFSTVAFLYLTIATALTGRTLGMRLLSLRIVDVRTGMIPTGSQSAGRALIYVASLLTFGVAAILFALADPEKQTAHDRLTHTAVILV
jgi:uncharacterized RDD family membrane protein YckC